MGDRDLRSQPSAEHTYLFISKLEEVNLWADLPDFSSVTPSQCSLLRQILHSGQYNSLFIYDKMGGFSASFQEKGREPFLLGLLV